jgi:hypothetical protein
MPQWEYSKRNLGDAPTKTDDIDLLNDAGRDGWELVAITVNNLAYLKRPLGGVADAEPPARQPARRRTASPRDSAD